jgi:6-phosphogluconolactonase (cycloisomerase 2 family)
LNPGVQTTAANLIATIPGPVTGFYADSGVTNVTQYYYVVTYTDPGGESPASSEAGLVYKDPVPPGAVTNFTATSGQQHQVPLSWTNPTDSDFTGVTIRRSSSGYPSTIASGTLVIDTSGATTSFTDTLVPGGAPMYYSAFAHDIQPKYAAAAQSSATPTTSGMFAYVAADSTVGSTSFVAGYSVDLTGALVPLVSSPYFTDHLVKGITLDRSGTAGKFAYVTNAGSLVVSAYAIDVASGALTGVAGSPFTVGPAPQGVTTDPSGKFAFVANFGSNTVSAFTINSTSGVLTSVAGSPFAAGPVGTHPVSVTLDPAGQFAFTANGNSVSVYTINGASGVLTLVTGSPFSAGASASLKGLTVDPSGSFVYVADSGTNGVLAFTITSPTGALTSVAGSPFSAGTNPVGVTIDPSGNFALVANNVSGTVSVYTISGTTGVLTPVAGSPFAAGANPVGVAVDAAGKFAFVANAGSSNVSVYSIHGTTGVLTPVAGSPFAADSGPIGVVVDVSGLFAFVPNSTASNISAYRVDGTTGVLTPVAGSPFAIVSPSGAKGRPVGFIRR